MLARQLQDVRVVDRAAVRVVAKKDLVAGATADTKKAVETEFEAARGGVLLVPDAHALLMAMHTEQSGARAALQLPANSHPVDVGAAGAKGDAGLKGDDVPCGVEGMG